MEMPVYVPTQNSAMTRQIPGSSKKELFRIMNDANVQLLMTKLTNIKQICQKELLGYRCLKSLELGKQR